MRYNEGTLDGLLIGAVMGITINALLLTIGFYSADNFVTFSILWAVVGVVVGAIRARKFRTVYDVRGGAACGFWIGAVFSIFYIAALFMAEAPIAPMITAMITIVFVHTIFTVAIGAAMGAILGMAKGMRQSEAKVPLVLRIIFAILFVIAVFLTVVIATAVGTPASMALVSAILIMAIDGIILYLAVPLVWWLIAHRKKVKFFAFVGISRPRFGGSKRTALVFAAVFVSAYTLYAVFMLNCCLAAASV
ncbi:MAG: hypothetical protein LBE55_00975 [Clostridiales bacterium]|jgi:hypothetical protein|nr:hypothetical protein [Clostridiales bacterium]